MDLPILEKDPKGFYRISPEVHEQLVQHISENFADTFLNLVVRPGDILSVTYDLKVLKDGHLKHIPHLVRSKE